VLKTDNPNSLYNPVPGYRRQAEWDDHGETYPMTHDGPDVWASVEVPDGVYRLSLYFFNKDGHDGMNRFRDYLVQLKPYTKGAREAEQAAPLARCRVRAFWGGVHKQFLVPGPAKYLVKIGKNDSFNTILSSVMIDRVHGEPGKWDSAWLPFMENVRYFPPVIPRTWEPGGEGTQAAIDLWRALDESYVKDRSWAPQRQGRLLAYRHVNAAKEIPAELLGRWRWAMPLLNAEDRKGLDEVLARARAERVKIEAAEQEGLKVFELWKAGKITEQELRALLDKIAEQIEPRETR
jgi:hypothetical protein